MNKKYIFITLGLAALALILMSASAGRNSGPNLAQPVRGQNIEGLGAAMQQEGARQNAFYGIYGFLNGFFSREGARFQAILNDWKTGNAFKVNGQGYGDFLNGDMRLDNLEPFKRKVLTYKQYIANPSNFAPGTKERVINRYRGATDFVLTQINNAMADVSQNI